LKVGKKLEEQIAKEGFDPLFGARPLKRVIQDKILDELAMLIVEKKVEASNSVNASLKNGRVEFKVS